MMTRLLQQQGLERTLLTALVPSPVSGLLPFSLITHNSSILTHHPYSTTLHSSLFTHHSSLITHPPSPIPQPSSPPSSPLLSLVWLPSSLLTHHP
eukprot:3255428-Rhodomonas_salina.2